MEILNYPGLLGLNLTITTQESEFLINIWKLFLDVWLAIQPQGSGQAAATNLSFSSRFCNIFVNTITTERNIWAPSDNNLSIL